MKFPFDPNISYSRNPIQVLGKYQISIDPDQFEDLLINSAKEYSRIFLLTDDHLRHHQSETLDKIKKIPRFAAMFSIKPGEKQKNWRSLDRILTSMLSAGLDRNSLLISFGGGVVGDMGALAASLFMRGIKCLMLPTSLLAMVDSSVGGKTAVNHPLGKNLIGTFYQPSGVLINTDYLTSLPPRHLLNGMAEVIKYGYIFDPNFLDFVNRNWEEIRSINSPTIVNTIIGYCCSAKAKIVEADEFEGGVRKFLNLGHTFGHAIESYYQYKSILHGEAVNIGMLIANFFSEDLGFIYNGFFEKHLPLHYALKPKIRLFLDADEMQLVNIMKKDKKNKLGKINLVLPNNQGVQIIDNLTEKKMLRLLLKAKKVLDKHFK